MNVIETNTCVLLNCHYRLNSLIRYFSNISFVPKCKRINDEEICVLKRFLNNSDKMLVLSGAGISTESGIPDYRSTGVGLYAKSKRRPVLYQEFCAKEAIRRRYWARNYVGWPRFSTIQPNITHKFLKQLEDEGKLNCIVTQNVDNLHYKAGSRNVIELHGTAFKVICLSCDWTINRFHLQEIFQELNPSIISTVKMIRPDGDVDISEDQEKIFVVPPCPKCGGIIKPDIVFFGDNVHQKVVQTVNYELEKADSLLILGTSLTTYSGYRIVLQALNSNKPMALINIGETRADKHIDIKLNGKCGDILSRILLL